MDTTFAYQPVCSEPGCDRPALYKIAAVWSDGTSRELKTYALACEHHRDAQRQAASSRRAGLKLAEGEVVEPIGVYRLLPGVRDAELTRLT